MDGPSGAPGAASTPADGSAKSGEKEDPMKGLLDAVKSEKK